MFRFAVLSLTSAAILGAGSSAFAQHRYHPGMRTRAHVGVYVGQPYYYGPYGAPYFYYAYAPYPLYYPPYAYTRDPYEVSGLRLKVHPNDARVFVDGYYAGSVDDFDGTFQQLDLKPGRHEIAVKREGYRTYRFKLYAAPGRTMKIAHELEKGDGPDQSVDEPPRR